MNSSTSTELRSIALHTEVAASVPAVWRALIDPGELMRWFPLEAEVRQGAGGAMRLSWGDPVVAQWTIEDWSPERLLRVIETRPLGILLQPREGDVPPRSVTFRIERRGNRTALSLLHEGFGCGPQWEEAYAAVLRGWEFQLHSLRHYLERHSGRARSVSRLRRTLSLPVPAVWHRLVGRVLRSECAGDLKSGGGFELAMENGSTWSGAAVIFDPPRQFAMTLRAMNDAMFRIYLVENAAGAAELSTWLASYGAAPAVVADFESRWTAVCNHLFPPVGAAETGPAGAATPPAACCRSRGSPAAPGRPARRSPHE